MADQTLWQVLSQAGWTMAPLYACSVVACALTLRKAVQFHLEGVDRRDGSEGTPLRTVLDATRGALADNPARAEAIAERTALAELDRLESGLVLLAFIAQAAPLFGLLGTVLGMVDLFAGMEAAGAAVQTSTLSQGIWKALLTTAAGLVIAIPTIGVHAWLGRRLDRLRLALEAAIGALLDQPGFPTGEAA